MPQLSLAAWVPVVSGCGEITVDYEAKQFTLGGKIYHEGDYISLDGSTGAVYGQALPTAEASISGDFSRFMQWADSARRLKVYANADNPMTQNRHATLVPRELDCAAQSICFSKLTASKLCVK